MSEWLSQNWVFLVEAFVKATIVALGLIISLAF